MGSFLIKITDNNLIFFGSGTAKQLNGSNVTDTYTHHIIYKLEYKHTQNYMTIKKNAVVHLKCAKLQVCTIPLSQLYMLISAFPHLGYYSNLL